MSDSVMMTWGPVRFSLSTLAYDSMSQSDEYRWATVERIARRPAKQSMGPGEQSITLSGVILGALDLTSSGEKPVGTMQIELVRQVAMQGVPYLLTDGRGHVHGMFCLANIEEEASEHTKDGAPRKQAFTITFERYGDDKEHGSQLIAGRQGDTDFQSTLRPGYIA